MTISSSSIGVPIQPILCIRRDGLFKALRDLALLLRLACVPQPPRIGRCLPPDLVDGWNPIEVPARQMC
jgi:hypothetical protein